MPEKSGSNATFDLLEKRFVFVVSRVFFWVLCGAAALGLAVAVILLLVNAVPATKQKISDPRLPDEVTVNSADVEEAMRPSAEPDRSEAPPGASEQAEEPEYEEADVEEAKPDPLLAKFAAAVDTVKSYFPPEKYAWDNIYGTVVTGRDYWGNPTRTERVVQRYGLVRYVYLVTDLYEDVAPKISVLQELAGIIAAVPVDDRAQALSAYAEIRVRREQSRQSEVAELQAQTELKRLEAEAKYASLKARKHAGLRDSLKYAVAGFAGVALIGLFLCFLAIERNTRALTAILERERSA